MIVTNLHSVLETRTAGDPDNSLTLWTDLSPYRIADILLDLGTPLSPPLIRDWLDQQHLGLRKIQKKLTRRNCLYRDQQFQRIADLREQYFQAGNPVYSIDTKAKEHLGQLYREGRTRTQRPFLAWDHDFPSWATGVVIPHGIYDLARNRGHINLGLSHDTSLFACDSFRWYWRRIGQQCYPQATSILWLCDCGGSNSASQYLFKNDLQNLVNEIGIEIRIAHYPSYCSKYNPIERRLFPHVGRSCQGILLDALETVVRQMRKATTRNGLKTTVNVISRKYETGRKTPTGFKTSMPLRFDKILPKWNYRATPEK